MNMKSVRIKEIISLLDPCRMLADIGCDHAYACIEAVQTKKAETALACDLRKGPLIHAKANIEKAGLQDKIKIVLSNGFREVKDSPDACIISGMGGLLIRDILLERPDRMTQMILVPHSEVPPLREYIIRQTEFTITAEKVIEDQGKLYPVLKAKRKTPDDPVWTYRDIMCGKPEIQSDQTGYLKYLKKEIDKIENSLKKLPSSGNETITARRSELASAKGMYSEVYEKEQL